MGNARISMLLTSLINTCKSKWINKDKLSLTHRRFEALLRSGNDLISIIGADGTYKYVSPSSKQVLNQEPYFYLGRTPFEFIHPDDVSRVKSEFEHVLSTEGKQDIAPFRFKNAEGDWCWVDCIATNMINDASVLGVVVNARDISIKIKDDQEKVAIAEKLRLSNERYELAAKATNDIIWDWDLEKNQLNRDKAFEKFSGLSHNSEALLHAPWNEYIHSDDKEWVLNSILTATDNPDEHFWQEEYRYIRADGSVAIISDRGYIVRDPAKKAIRMVGAMHDITELKAKEQRLFEQSSKMHDIANINSHIIRKPVASILALTELIDKELILGEDNKQILNYLLTCCKELDAVIRKINSKTSD